MRGVPAAPAVFETTKVRFFPALHAVSLRSCGGTGISAGTAKPAKSPLEARLLIKSGCSLNIIYIIIFELLLLYRNFQEHLMTFFLPWSGTADTAAQGGRLDSERSDVFRCEFRHRRDTEPQGSSACPVENGRKTERAEDRDVRRRRGISGVPHRLVFPKVCSADSGIADFKGKG